LLGRVHATAEGYRLDASYQSGRSTRIVDGQELHTLKFRRKSSIPLAQSTGSTVRCLCSEYLIDAGLIRETIQQGVREILLGTSTR
jgi:hypothetical protein